MWRCAYTWTVYIRIHSDTRHVFTCRVPRPCVCYAVHPCLGRAAGFRHVAWSLAATASYWHILADGTAAAAGRISPCALLPRRLPSPWPHGSRETVEHGACLGPLQASRRQRHVRNSALLSSALRRVASRSGFGTGRVFPSVDPSKNKKKSRGPTSK